jgi:hypothetical protein
LDLIRRAGIVATRRKTDSLSDFDKRLLWTHKTNRQDEKQAKAVRSMQKFRTKRFPASTQLQSGQVAELMTLATALQSGFRTVLEELAAVHYFEAGPWLDDLEETSVNDASNIGEKACRWIPKFGRSAAAGTTCGYYRSVAPTDRSFR